MATPKELTEMTPEERDAAFAKWFEGDRNKKIKGQARRAAIQDLVKKYKSEYDQLVSKHTTRLGGSPQVPATRSKSK